MKLETAKSFILIILIGISLLLTFGLWSYQPNLQKVSEEHLDEVVNIGGADNETKRTVVEAHEIIFHSNDQYYGFTEPKHKKNLYEEMQTWTISDFETRLTNGRKSRDYEVEVIFPSRLPMEILRQLLTFVDNEISLPNWSFDRMYFTFNPDSKSLNIEFLSIDGRNEAIAVINDSSYFEHLWSYLQPIDDNVLREYVLFEDVGNGVYLPKDKMNVRKQSFTYNYELINDPDLLAEVLFPDLSLVSQSYSSETTYYTDSQRGMNIYPNSGRMEYVDPYSEDSVVVNQSAIDILNSSIMDINSHSGWTNDYNLMEVNAKENFIRYQLYYGGYPVFSPWNLAYIDQKWNNQRLNEYHRPLFQLKVALGGSTVQLMSGPDLINYMTKHYNLESIQDVRLGYRLIYHYDDEDSKSGNNVNDKFIELTPAWFKQEGGDWNEITFSDDQLIKGGD